MQVKITTLSENEAGMGFIAEWGLSMLVEVEGAKILVDTGRSFSATYNAPLLGVDLAAVDRVVLTHGHGDHTGGLRDLLRRRGEVETIAHPGVFDEKYAGSTKKDTFRYCGLPFARAELESLGAKFNLVRTPLAVTDRAMTSGEIPEVTEYEKVEDNLYVKQAGRFEHDILADDLALIVDADFGLVVVLGCAHRGAVNTVRQAQALTGGKQAYAVVGGMHLFRASDERIERTIADLRGMGVQKVAASHCTGFAAASRFAQEFGDGYIHNHAGTRLTLP